MERSVALALMILAFGLLVELMGVRFIVMPHNSIITHVCM